MSITMQAYINKKLEEGKYRTQAELAHELGLKIAIVNHYKTGHTKQPTLEVARHIYKLDGTVIWPYSEEAVSQED